MTCCAATGSTPRMTRCSASRSSRPSVFGNRPAPTGRRRCLPAWNPRRSSRWHAEGQALDAIHCRIRLYLRSRRLRYAPPRPAPLAAGCGPGGPTHRGGPGIRAPIHRSDGLISSTQLTPRSEPSFWPVGVTQSGTTARPTTASMRSLAAAWPPTITRCPAPWGRGTG
jgi:hypothetical protein